MFCAFFLRQPHFSLTPSSPFGAHIFEAMRPSEWNGIEVAYLASF